MKPLRSTPSRRTFLRASAYGLVGLGAGYWGLAQTDADIPGIGYLGSSTPPDRSEMTVVLAESFDAAPLNSSTWRKTFPWGNGLTDTYNGYGAPENVVVRDGSLVLTAEERPQRGKDYTTGVVSSRRSFSFGYFEAEIKVPPISPGFWPAFWLTAADSEWPEIDLFEYFGADRRVWMAFHYLDANGEKQRDITAADWQPTPNEFHRYSVHWTPSDVTWYIDGTERYHIHHEFDPEVRMWLIINFGINPAFLAPPRSADLPAQMEVRNVRVWQI